MPFRASFACLWCGTAHTTRSPDDLEGWAQLCPSCIGKAGENNFLRFRLRQALTERSAAAPAAPAGRAASAPPAPAGRAASALPAPPASAPPSPPVASVPIDDDWYLRLGPASRGPIHDAAFLAELDAAGRWLDALPLSGAIVQLEAGTGWWAPLLASKGELSLYDRSSEALDRSRERLVAHELRAHLHVRDPWAAPERSVDVVLASTWFGRLAPGHLAGAVEAAHAWLRPGGRLVVIDALEGAGPQESGFADAATVGSALIGAGLTDVEITSPGRFLVLATGIASATGSP